MVECRVWGAVVGGSSPLTLTRSTIGDEVMSMSETVAILEAFEKLRDACHKNSVDHGFWNEGDTFTKEVSERNDSDLWVNKTISCKEKPWNFGEKIALLHSELSEMFEAWRKGEGDKPCDKPIEIIDPKYRTPDDLIGHRRMTNIEEEVADVIIRLLDLCGKLDIDVGRVVLAKHEYNKSRPFMHGGRKC